MIGTHDLPLFVVSALLLNVTPGPDTLYIVGRSAQGFRAGAVAALGISERATLRTIFVQGFWTNVLNPKVALFFLAFLPQFVDAWSAARVGHALGSSIWFNRCIGALFIYLGARLALAEK